MNIKDKTFKRKLRQPTLRDATWERSNDIYSQDRYNLRTHQVAQYLCPTADRVSVTHNNNFKATATQHLVAQQVLHACIAYIYNADGNKQNIDMLLKDNPERWASSLSNEWGRLSLGNDNNIEFTDTIKFITYDEVPKNKKVTYAHFVCDYRPFKDENGEYALLLVETN